MLFRSGNDDAIRSVRLITAAIADAAIQGSMQAEVAIAEAEMDMGAAEADAATEAMDEAADADVPDEEVSSTEPASAEAEV